MEVWDPGEEMTVFSQIKKLITGLYRGLKGWVVRLYPGNLAFRVKDRFYALCEHYGGRLSCWAWHKRWNRRNQRKYTHSEEMQNKLEPIEDDWWERHKSYIEHRKEFPYYPEKNKSQK